MVYALDKLMSETRRLASEYHLATAQVMPVTAELARYDGIRLLNLQPLDRTDKGVDALGYREAPNKKIQIKGRVIFNPHKTDQRIGALNFSGEWEILMLVIYDANYHPSEIYALDRSALDPKDGASAGKSSKKGPVSVQKCRKIGQLVWQS